MTLTRLLCGALALVALAGWLYWRLQFHSEPFGLWRCRRAWKWIHRPICWVRGHAPCQMFGCSIAAYSGGPSPGGPVRRWTECSRCYRFFHEGWDR